MHVSQTLSGSTVALGLDRDLRRHRRLRYIKVCSSRHGSSLFVAESEAGLSGFRPWLVSVMVLQIMSGTEAAGSNNAENLEQAADRLPTLIA